MAPQRPRSRQIIKQTILQEAPNLQPLLDPQVAFLVDREALEVIPPQYKEVILGIIGSDITAQFCRLQRDAFEKKLRELPLRMDLSDPKNFQFVKELRLTWRFWIDLLNYSEELKAQQE